MKKFEKTTLMKCKVEELFDFHLDLDNLKKITPPNIKVELISLDVKPKKDSIIKIKTTKFFIPTVWTIKIKEFDRPNILVDIAIKSPFSYWEHQHIFIKYENYSLLKDKIVFKLPFSLLAGIFEPWVYNDIVKVFQYRHEMTKKILESS